MTANQAKLPSGSAQEDALENHLQQDETENTNFEHIFQLFAGRQYAKCLWAINVSKLSSKLRIFDASCCTHVGNCEEEVLKKLIAAHAKDPKSSFIHCELGLRHYINGDFEGALEFFTTGFRMHKSRMYQALDCFNNKTSLSSLFKQAAGEFKKICKGCRILTLSTLIEPEDVTIMNKDLVKDLIKRCPHKPCDENTQRKRMWLDSDSEEESSKPANDDETLRKILESRNQKEELTIKKILQLFVDEKYSECLRAVDATKLDTKLFILKASCMTHLGIQQDKALQILNNALVRKSKDSATNYELGLSHYINGDFEEALEFFRTGYKLNRNGMHQALEYCNSKPSLSTLFEQAAAEFTAVCSGCRVLSLAAFIHPESPSIMTRAKKLIDSCSHVKAEAEDGELSSFETPIRSNTVSEDSNALRPKDLNSNDLLDINSFEVKSEHILETSLESDVSLTSAQSATPVIQPGRCETQDSLISQDNGSSSTASEDPKGKPKLPEKSEVLKRRNAMNTPLEAPKKIETKKLSRSFKRPIRLGSIKKEKFKAVAVEHVKQFQKMYERRWAIMYPRKRSQFSKIVAIKRCIDSDFWDSDSSDEDTKESISDDSDSDYSPTNPDVKLDLPFYKKNKKRGKAKLDTGSNEDSAGSNADNKKARSKKKKKRRNDEPILQMIGFYDESFKLSPVKTEPKRKNKPKKKLDIDEVTYTSEKDMFAAINAQLEEAPPIKKPRRSVGMGKLPPKFEKARIQSTIRQIQCGKRLPPKGIFPLLSPVRATPTSPFQSPTYPSSSMYSAMLPSCSSYMPTTSPPHYSNNWNSTSESQTDFESEIPSYLTPNYLDSASRIKAETSISITDVEDELDGAFAAKNKASPVMAASSSLLSNESSSESDEQTTSPLKKKIKSINNSSQSSAPRLPKHTENSEDKSAKFEELYDAAFDVTLPSMLWGIHRCPKRKFVVFSKFSETKDAMSIHVKISNNFECTANANGLLKISIQLSLEQLDVEYVSFILDKLDQEDFENPH